MNLVLVQHPDELLLVGVSKSSLFNGGVINFLQAASMYYIKLFESVLTVLMFIYFSSSPPRGLPCIRDAESMYETR